MYTKFMFGDVNFVRMKRNISYQFSEKLKKINYLV